MRIQTILLLAAGLLITGFPASSQEPAKEAKIERILALTNTDATLDQVFRQVKAMAMSQMPAGSTPEARAKVQQTQDKIMDMVKSRLNWEKLRPQYVKIYSETFTAGEIDGLLAFYESPAGRAMMEKMPVLIAKTIAVTQGQMAEIMPEIQRIAKEAASQDH